MIARPHRGVLHLMKRSPAGDAGLMAAVLCGEQVTHLMTHRLAVRVIGVQDEGVRCVECCCGILRSEDRLNVTTIRENADRQPPWQRRTEERRQLAQLCFTEPPELRQDRRVERLRREVEDDAWADKRVMTTNLTVQPPEPAGVPRERWQEEHRPDRNRRQKQRGPFAPKAEARSNACARALNAHANFP
jgi:hypothetical protein